MILSNEVYPKWYLENALKRLVGKDSPGVNVSWPAPDCSVTWAKAGDPGPHPFGEGT